MGEAKRRRLLDPNWATPDVINIEFFHAHGYEPIEQIPVYTFTVPRRGTQADTNTQVFSLTVLIMRLLQDPCIPFLKDVVAAFKLQEGSKEVEAMAELLKVAYTMPEKFWARATAQNGEVKQFSTGPECVIPESEPVAGGLVRFMPHDKRPQKFAS